MRSLVFEQVSFAEVATLLCPPPVAPPSGTERASLLSDEPGSSGSADESLLDDSSQPTDAEVAAPVEAEQEAEDKNSPSALRNLLLGTTPGLTPDSVKVLALDSAEEVAALVTVLLALASLDNQKDALSLASAGLTAAQATPAFLAVEATLPLQRFARKAGGVLDLDKKTKSPRAEIDSEKLAKLFASPSTMLSVAKNLPWAETESLKALDGAVTSRATHLPRLSNSWAAGGVALEPLEPDAYQYSVSEADYLSTAKQTLTCSAGYQKYGLLALALCQYRGQVYRLPVLLREQPDLSQEVAQLLVAREVPSAESFIKALTVPPTSALRGCAQVFVSTVQRNELVIGNLTVLTPFSLPGELGRARRALSQAYSLQREDMLGLSKSVVDVMTEELSAMKEQAPDKAAPKPMLAVHKAKMTEVKAALDLEKGRHKALEQSKPKFLTIPLRTLPVGGSKPNNVAYSLSLALHKLPLYVEIGNSKRGQQLGRKSFYANALIQVPRVKPTATGTLPTHFKPGRNSSEARRYRAKSYIELTAQALNQLMVMKDAYAVQAASTFSSADLQNVRASAEPWALFVKGDEQLNKAEMANRLAPLARDVFIAVKGALKDAWGDMPDEFDAELSKVVASTISIEHA